MEQKVQEFQQEVWDYYVRHGRSMPWRNIRDDGTIDPYHILVSELMLQQTQVQRVVPKFKTFISVFPSIKVLSQAKLSDVVREWQGLGYNRRAKFLLQSAKKVMDQYAGVIPGTEEELQSLPGVGRNTAAAIYCYAFNKPTSFIETNIRTVFISHFFPDEEAVVDTKILDLVALCCDKQEPRQWYWALMDYGTYIKSTQGNASRQSASYVKQAPFKGSRREIRGKVIKILGQSMQTYEDLLHYIHDERLPLVLGDLEKEGFIYKDNNSYTLV